MFLFDWMKIYDASQGNVREVVRIFRMLVSKQIPDNRKDPIYKYSHKDFSGVSFMLHPDVLLYHSHKYTYREISTVHFAVLFPIRCRFSQHTRYDFRSDISTRFRAGNHHKQQ